jgi:transcriptional regulator with XRE-family HTH domain
MELANRIRKIRESYGFTQADIAFKVEITPQAYGKIERRAAKTKIETLYKIANSLSVSLSFLVDINNPNFIEAKNNL